MALDRSTWRKATILELKSADVTRPVKVHYEGWHKRYDEWVQLRRLKRN